MAATVASITPRGRNCEGCGVKMGHQRRKRDKETGKYLCEGCQNGRPGRPRNGAYIARTAHMSQDPAVVFHCYSCGSGQVIGRSDGIVQCDFCGACFIVIVQPQFPSSPQSTENSVQEPPDAGAEGAEEDEGDRSNSFGGGSLSDKIGEDPSEDSEDEDPPADDSGDDKGNPFAKSGSRFFMTETGVLLDEERYIKHLAWTTHD